ncbi:hypothetical protein Fmac_000864 [Flemingia macrophylla]|uniref:Uncharacterized protein n=1 Tax=Flemingia macrophylla TaxID=520843 RepID=A0ABD1NFG3_9FABA
MEKWKSGIRKMRRRRSSEGERNGYCRLSMDGNSDSEEWEKWLCEAPSLRCE